MIQCSNPACRTVLATPASCCKVCQTPLLYRFLLAVGEAPLTVRPGTLVAGRFLVWSNGHGPARETTCLWLDTRPDTPVPPLEQLPAQVLLYQKLFHLAQHLPRPYAYLTPEQSGQDSPILLLDMAPIATRRVAQDDGPEQVEATLLTPLATAWGEASGLRQLNWLRQVATLWSPLAAQQAASALLDLSNLRVDSALLRLTTLVPDAVPASLGQLGQRWRDLLPQAQPAIAPYLGWLVAALSEGQLTAAALVAELEAAIQALAQGLAVAVDWVADTDQGPTRDRNEDACYPCDEPRQQRLTATTGPAAVPLLLVCDGIGGHEQGNVASQTAIKLLQQELEPLAQEPHLSPWAIAKRLKQALILANDAIVARNNDEQRAARARMGTTVVVALVHFPYVSIAHIGDSRAYRVSAHTCYQVTVDDDVASREAQMGYALHSEAVQLPSGGALIQALGISDSGYLYPSVQHLLLDDAAVLLLCSDGLSDYDRVDALAPTLVAPLAGSGQPLAPAVASLIQQANRLNGHDNVTVGLMRLAAQVTGAPPLPGRSLARRADLAARQTPIPPRPTAPAAPARARFPWGALLGGAAVVLTGLGAALGWQAQRPAPVALRPLGAALPATALGAGPLAGPALAATATVPVGSFWQVIGSPQEPLVLLPQPGAAPPPTAVAAGSILRVVSRQRSADNTDWVRLQVCSIPSGASFSQSPQETDSPGAVPGAATALSRQLSAPEATGWVDTRQFYSSTALLELVTPAQAGRCAGR